VTRTEEHGPVGATFESWLEEEGLLEEATEHAVKAVISWQLQKTMEERGLSKKAMAALMGTSRSQLDRLLDPESDAVTLKSLMRAARLVGKKIKIDLVDAA
jgi:predicted XRE-type DNA-binding protein